MKTEENKRWYHSPVVFPIAIVIVALLGTIGVMAVVANEKPKPTPIIKIGPNSPQARVINLFNSRFKKMNEFSNVVWVLDGNEELEEVLFAGATPQERELITKELVQIGAKRYNKTCYNGTSEKNHWSAGYCVAEPLPIKAPQS